MPSTEAQKRASRKYEQSGKAVKITLTVSPAQRDQINSYCESRGGTATYIKELLRDDMRANGVVPIEAGKENAQ